MSTAAATQSAAAPDAIVAALWASFCDELEPVTEIERMLLLSAAQAQYRLQAASTKLLEVLETEGYTDHYFRLQRSEAKDRAALIACLNQFHKMESRRLRNLDRNSKKPAAAAPQPIAKDPPPPPAEEHETIPESFPEIIDKLAEALSYLTGEADRLSPSSTRT